MDALIVGDVHLADKAPSSRTPDYTNQILGKISFAAEEAKRRNCPLVFAGDVFHIKAASKNSHRLVQAMHSALQGVRTFIVPGNHDLEGDRLDSLDKQPLGALARMDAVSLLMGKDAELPGIVGIPYLTQFDGGDWQAALEEWNYGIDEPELIVTHAPLFPPGQAPGVYASIDPNEWAEFFIGIPATYYGHIHDYHGVYTDTNGYMQFCNQGALSRGSLHESSVSRVPGITFWDGANFERVEVPHLPAAEVFLFDQAQVKAEQRQSAKAFAEALGATILTALTLEEVLATIKESDIDAAVMRQIEECLETAQ